MEELHFPVGVGLVVLSHPDVENIIVCPGVIEEELQTLGSRFGIKPATLQKSTLTRLCRGCAEVHEVTFPWAAKVNGDIKYQHCDVTVLILNINIVMLQ